MGYGTTVVGRPATGCRSGHLTNDFSCVFWYVLMGPFWGGRSCLDILNNCVCRMNLSEFDMNQ